MIKLKLSRDEARLIEARFLPYMIMWCKSNLLNTWQNDIEYLNARLLLSIIEDVDLAFKRKLLTKTNKLHFSFSQHAGISLYMLLLKQPIDIADVWAHNFRQKKCNEIHQQIYNKPGV